MGRRLAILALAAALTPAAAGAQTPPDGRPDPSIADGRAQAALDAARQRWAAAGLRDYRFTVALQCFCIGDVTEPRVLTVRRGKPRKPPRHLRNVATVRRLFARVQDAIDAGLARLVVRYGERGLPRLVAIDSSLMIADEEVTYRASRLRALR
jgi:hypothetical protein